MLSEPSYLGARMVAPAIAAHFAHHLALTTAGGAALGPPPAVPLLEALIDVAFWTSLRQEEGHPPKISLALLSSAQTTAPLELAHRLRLTPHNLLKLAPAVEQPGTHLGVWAEGDDLYIWGTATRLPALCLVLEVVEPGLLVVKHSRQEGLGKFINVAVLRGDQLQMVDEENRELLDCPALLASLYGMPLLAQAGTAVNVLVELAAAMRLHGRGGLVLLVPPQSATWQASIVQPLKYPVLPPFGTIAELLHRGTTGPLSQEWQESLLRAIGVVGGFTAVDGATVLTQGYEMLAFGAKVTRAATSTPVEQMVITEPVVGSQPRTVHPAQNGGTRHLAAAQFVHDQRDSLALVASQDGFFTLFAWSNRLEMVHAHRIDVLLL
ncbi:putative sensor domain DACNV-containing protein [Hymenobacter terricola]|uniref:putative sensor domain DACNV-containing protein n=1 Tax=Hymenobacter terricola TaxID=2819236 RepID=UPI001B303180|nr:hypothetical protein [Hymenobacter terricola]